MFEPRSIVIPIAVRLIQICGDQAEQCEAGRQAGCDAAARIGPLGSRWSEQRGGEMQENRAARKKRDGIPLEDWSRIFQDPGQRRTHARFSKRFRFNGFYVSVCDQVYQLL
ncbi:UNVERIFIED_CONTAM: hypothetical protein FKN15_009264 [Acipenser sinensis]